MNIVPRGTGITAIGLWTCFFSSLMHYRLLTLKLNRESWLQQYKLHLSLFYCSNSHTNNKSGEQTMNFIHESSSPKLYIKSNISFSLLSLQISGKFDKVFDVADISVYVRFGSKI